jgi:hypothetical protein
MVRNTYHVQKLSQAQSLYDQLVYQLIFWNGSGGCGAHRGEPPGKTSALIRKVLISLALQPRDHFIYQLGTLRVEFIYAVSGRLTNLKIKFLEQVKRRYLAREDEIRAAHQNSEKEDGM